MTSNKPLIELIFNMNNIWAVPVVIPTGSEDHGPPTVSPIRITVTETAH